MSKPSDSKPAASDPLLILIAALLLVAVVVTIYFSVNGPAKEFSHEPAARPRPIIQDEPHVVVVTKVIAGGVAAAAPDHDAAPKPAVEPAKSEAVAVAVAAPVVKATTDGKIRGKIVLKGMPPLEKSFAGVKGDSNCGPAHPNDTPTSRNYVVGPDGGLRYALVRILNAPEGAGTPATEAPLIDQIGCMYEPYVSAVQVDHRFDVRNSDAFMHNVNATPKLNKGFNIVQATAGQVAERKYDKPELFAKFACNVHPWMMAYLHVLENPFFAVTDGKGEFVLPEGLPAGKYSLEVNHLKAGIVSTEIEVSEGKGLQVLVEMGVK